MNSQNIPILQQNSIDAILEKGVDFTVTVAKPTILHRLGLLRKERRFVIKPLHPGTLLRISRLILDMDIDVLRDAGDDLFSKGVLSIDKHMDTMVKIIAHAIENAENEPSHRLMKYLRENLTVSEMLKIIILVTRQMDVKDFLACMVSIRNLNLFETKKESTPQNQTGSIHGRLSEASLNTLESDGTTPSGT